MAKGFGIFQRTGSNSSSDHHDKGAPTYDYGGAEANSVRRGSVDPASGLKDTTHRGLKARHIQLIGIGGTIGTALYVQIGRGLLNGGPASLFIAFSFWCCFILAVTISMNEMVTYLPISSPFVRFAGRYVDEAFGFAAGWYVATQESGKWKLILIKELLRI